MNLRMKYIFGFALLLVGTLLSPQEGFAYFTTDQEAFTVNSKVGVYTIDFAFGHEKHEVRIPVRAIRGGSAVNSSIRYELLNGTDAVLSGSAVGIVLSDAAIENGMYVIPKGKSETFTLLVLYTAPVGVKNNYAVTVSHLPFTFGLTQQLQLNPSELTYYTTPSLSLGSATILGK
jgi:hypothetical protein